MAKRFRFRLETVRRLRKQAQDECRRVVAERLRQVAAVRSRINEMDGQLAEQRATVRNLVLPSPPADDAGAGQGVARLLDMDRMRRHRLYMNHLRQGIARGERQAAELQGLLRKDQAALAEATKRVRVIDKLEERQRSRHELMLRRAETAENDEIAAQFARRQSATGLTALLDEQP